MLENSASQKEKSSAKIGQKNLGLDSLGKYLSMVKFSHTIFAMPFAFIGFFLAIQINSISLDWTLLAKVILCMIFARNAAMGFNRWADRSIDLENPRTAIREIPSGMIKANSALWFVIINAGLFIATTYFINTLCFYLSPVALLVVLGYSLTKRFTALCHLILGLGLALAPIGAYLAVTGRFDILPLFFSFAVLFWVSGFDVIYALQDEEFDREHKLSSIPVWLGKTNALRLSTSLHLICGSLIIAAGFVGHFGMWYWIGASIFNILLVYQHMLVKPNDLSRVNLAFFTTNGIASVTFAIFVIADLLLQ
ncbi:MAG: 4-hydroxybenzoate polyprenyltransferase [Granulosicoccus sp.]|jgi:4-hydroxybenzoate polyprenyltransferase